MKNVYTLRVLFLVTLCFPGLTAQGQDTPAKPKPKVEVIARAQPDRILLRWAPTTPAGWQYANQYGYVVERYTVLKDSLLTTPRKTVLTPSLKPTPLPQWESAVKGNKYAAVAAQALYGETFQLSEQQGNSVTQIIHKSKELESRFSFALFAADQSLEVARLSGLFYEDKTARPDEKYLYRVYAQVPPTKMKMDTGFVYVGLADHQPLPKPLDLEARFADRVVELRWNRQHFERIYNSFLVERSDDEGASFRSISDLPILNTVPENQLDPQYAFKLDSLPENNRRYSYRVRGISPFGEMSPPSDTVSSKGRGAFVTSPVIVQKTLLANGQVKLEWDFPDSARAGLSGFTIGRSQSPKGVFEAVGKVSSAARTYLDGQPNHTNYYTVTAHDAHGSATTSLPVLVQLMDSLPPAPPVALAGRIDSTGRVVLRWKANAEKDMYGYRVYRANFLSEEFTQVTVEPVQDTLFTDTINVRTLTPSVYYKVMAVDRSQNPSGFSAPLALKRPDVLPPVAPVFVAVNASDRGIELRWVNSSSADVVQHLLYRRPAGKPAWEPVAAFKRADSVVRYVDVNAGIKTTYEYTLIAQDESGLRSEPAKPITAKRIDNGVRLAMEEVTATADREQRQIALGWNGNRKNVDRYLLYRAEADGPMRLYKTLPATTTAYQDKSLVINTMYTYWVKTVYQDGAQTAFSKAISVNY
jgi:fibronectin type 3 domain-containing protein